MKTQQIKKEDIEISKDDQVYINNFSKLNLKYHELNQEYRQKKEFLDAIDDALTEIELVDDENDIRLKFGDCFVRVDVDFSRDYLERIAKDYKEETDGLKLAVDDSQKRMNKLKSTLYTKFGNSIQLEED